jgi:outer membrane protein OmpA-like peptidoglycan-associated protein
MAGCSDTGPGDPQGAASFVIGARSNMPAPRLDGQALAVLEEAVENQSYVSMVVADGEPSVIGEKDLLIEGANDVAREQSKQENRQEVEQGILAAKADDEEVDLLTALDLAARTVRSTNTTPSTIVVVDSGLSTVPPLDFTREGMLGADPQDVVDNLKAQDALPDLSDLAVVWQGMGDTAPPQEPLSNGRRKNLQAIWAAILAAAGTRLEIEEHPLTQTGVERLPRVTPVPLPEPECTAGSVTLTAADVAFEPDSAEFLDEAAAREVLTPLADQLAAVDGVTVTLTGTTVDLDDLQGQLDLSRRRAQAVLELLAELGVPESSMTAEGVGSRFPGYVPDRNPDRSLDPAAAAQNRKVIVTPSRADILTCP